jgi:hypothetical protein
VSLSTHPARATNLKATAFRPNMRAHPVASWPDSDVDDPPPCGVEMWRGGLGLAYLLPALSFAGASLSKPCSVSTSRSSNWTGAVNASSSRRKHHDFAHEKLRVRSVSRTKPNLSCRMASEYFRVVSLASLCLAHNH